MWPLIFLKKVLNYMLATYCLGLFTWPFKLAIYIYCFMSLDFPHFLPQVCTVIVWLHSILPSLYDHIPKYLKKLLVNTNRTKIMLVVLLRTLIEKPVKYFLDFYFHQGQNSWLTKIGKSDFNQANKIGWIITYISNWKRWSAGNQA